MTFKHSFYTLLIVTLSLLGCQEKQYQNFNPGEVWLDTAQEPINAHGGGICFKDGTYYWFGEYRNAKEDGFTMNIGITCYSSVDLMHWHYESIALPVVHTKGHDIEKGCIMERPKVIYNEKTKQYVMWFHLELKGRGYDAARTAVAVSNSATGPYTYLGSLRPNANTMPLKQSQWDCDSTSNDAWWTPQWYQEIEAGLFAQRDFKQGQMSRDMTLFVDDDGKAYHIHSSEDNLTLHISLLSDDYLSFSKEWTRIFPGGHNEAPAVFKRHGTYYMITSGCTGWTPNKGRLYCSEHLLGEWQYLGNPFKGKESQLSFHSQSTYVLPVNGKEDGYIYWGDRWNPDNLIDSRYIVLPIRWDNGVAEIHWEDQWNLSIFE